MINFYFQLGKTKFLYFELLKREYNKAFDQNLEELELLIVSPEDATLKEPITILNLGDEFIVRMKKFILLNKLERLKTEPKTLTKRAYYI